MIIHYDIVSVKFVGLLIITMIKISAIYRPVYVKHLIKSAHLMGSCDFYIWEEYRWTNLSHNSCFKKISYSETHT